MEERDEKSAAQTALEVQWETNLAILVQKWAYVNMLNLWPTENLEEQKMSLKERVEWINTHPVSVMFADRAAELACPWRESSKRQKARREAAYEACKKLAA